MPPTIIDTLGMSWAAAGTESIAVPGTAVAVVIASAAASLVRFIGFLLL